MQHREVVRGDGLHTVGQTAPDGAEVVIRGDFYMEGNIVLLKEKWRGREGSKEGGKN